MKSLHLDLAEGERDRVHCFAQGLSGEDHVCPKMRTLDEDCSLACGEASLNHRQAARKKEKRAYLGG